MYVEDNYLSDRVKLVVPRSWNKCIFKKMKKKMGAAQTNVKKII